MKRAAVFIGVDNTGGLPQLNDAARSAQRMARDWAKAQGISPVKVLTDAGGKKVTAKQVKTAIEAILKRGNIEQLIVYFAGHGINKANGEYWLLSGAPVDPQEAVNMRGSEDLAKYCGIPHVVFISDACRTAADSIGAQRVSGSEIFPNKQVTQQAKPVDLYFACAIGDPAQEIRDPRKSAGGFKAVYTAEMIDALNFRHLGIAESAAEGAKRVSYIRPLALKEHLDTAVPRRIRDLRMAATVIQVPDGQIAARNPPVWISRRAGAVAPAARVLKRAKGGGGGGGSRITRARAVKTVKRAPAVTAATISTGLLRTALSKPKDLASSLESARLSRSSHKKGLANAALEVAVPFGPMHQESQCGFKVRGSRFLEAIALGGRTEMTTQPADVVRVWDVPRNRAALVLLVLENGNGIVLPAQHEFLAALTIQGNNLVDVSYEPSDNTGRWNEYRDHAKELRELRSVVASATRRGTFRLGGKDALDLAQRMQYAKGLDPSLSVYAAYAYNDLQREDLIAEMHGFLQSDLGNALFDVAMLAFPPGPKSRAAMDRAVGFAPLLSQGWAYMGSRRIKLPRGLEKLPETLVNSVWTQFDPEGVALLRRSLFKKEKR